MNPTICSFFHKSKGVSKLCTLDCFHLHLVISQSSMEVFYVNCMISVINVAANVFVIR